MLALLAGLLPLFGSAARAYDEAAARAACTPDAFRVCSEFIPDVGRTTACMRRKRASLSPECRAAMGGGGGRHGEHRGYHHYRHHH
jgi:hypothetical protein